MQSLQEKRNSTRSLEPLHDRTNNGYEALKERAIRRANNNSNDYASSQTNNKRDVYHGEIQL